MKSWTNYASLLVIFLISNSLEFPASEIFSFMPSFSENFEEIIVLTDEVFQLPDDAEFYATFTTVSRNANSTKEALRHTAFSMKAVIVAPSNRSSLAVWVPAVFKHTRHWHCHYFILSPDHVHILDVEKAVVDMNLLFPLNSDVYWFVEDTNHTLQLWETFSVKGLPITQKVSAVEGLDIRESLMSGSKWIRRQDFQGVLITAAAVDDEEYTEEQQFKLDANGTKIFDSGYVVDLFRTFRDFLNFTEKDAEGDYMHRDPKSEKPTMQDLLSEGTADIAITASPIDEEIAQGVQILHPIQSTWLELRFVEMPSLWRFFVGPFENSVWGVIFIYSVVMVALVSFYRRILFHYYGRTEEIGKNSVSLNALWIVATLCMQGWYDWPRSSSMRLLLLVASVTGFLLNAAYSGVLTSQLSTEPVSLVKFEDLLNMRYGFFLEEQLVFPIDLDEFPQWNGISVSQTANSTALEAFQKVLDGKSVFISYPEYYWRMAEEGNYTQTEACNLCTAIQVGRTPSLSAMAVSRTSELKEIINILTLKIMERGLLRRLYLKYKRNRILKCDTHSPIIESQTLRQLFMAYAVLFIGLAAAIIIFILERIASVPCGMSLEDSHDFGRRPRFPPLN